MGHVAGFDFVPSRSNGPSQYDGAAETASFAGQCRNTQSIAIRDLHPTQMTVGYREIANRRERRRAALAKGNDVFRSLSVPVALGPSNKCYILDRHHELCVLAAEGITDVQVNVVEDLRRFEWVRFWRTLDRYGWCRPRDADGRRQDYSYIPTTIDALSDDPFRSLARALRRVGGYAKQTAPFSDFVWADFLRGRVPRTLVNDDFEAALQAALALSRNCRPTPNPLLQAAKIVQHSKTPGLPTKSSTLGLLDAVSTEAARDCTSTGQPGQ